MSQPVAEPEAVGQTPVTQKTQETLDNAEEAPPAVEAEEEVRSNRSVSTDRSWHAAVPDLDVLAGHRRIVSEDSTWNIPAVPPLTDLCVSVIVDNFITHPVLQALPAKYQGKVLHMLSIDVPIAVAAPVIHDENYWKRRSLRKWETCDVAKHGSSWKRLFFERMCQEEIQSYNPNATALSSLVRTFVTAQNFVFCLMLEQLPSHLDVRVLFRSLPYINQLHMCYGVKDLGMEFEWNKFGAYVRDIRDLARAVKINKELIVLSLENSLLDCENIRVLAGGLVDNCSITSLTLSHNKIKDRGAAAIGKVLEGSSSEPCLLTHLDVSDNSIGSEGAEAIGKALARNEVLLSLNMKLNRMKQEGGCALFTALKDNHSITQLNVAGNMLEGKRCAAALCDFLCGNNTLCSLNVSSNKFGVQPNLNPGDYLWQGIDANTSLTEIDLRGTGIDVESESSIKQKIEQNRRSF